jgi:hypothetical protein
MSMSGVVSEESEVEVPEERDAEEELVTLVARV